MQREIDWGMYIGECLSVCQSLLLNNVWQPFSVPDTRLFVKNLFTLPGSKETYCSLFLTPIIICNFRVPKLRGGGRGGGGRGGGTGTGRWVLGVGGWTTLPQTPTTSTTRWFSWLVCLVVGMTYWCDVSTAGCRAHPLLRAWVCLKK